MDTESTEDLSHLEAMQEHERTQQKMAERDSDQVAADAEKADADVKHATS